MKKKCPNCDSDAGVYWNDHGNTFEYHQVFGGSVEQREVVKTTNSTTLPTYCRCLSCDKRFEIKDIEIEL